MSNVTFKDSNSLLGHGSGIKCLYCDELSIDDSKFHNLTSIAGSAVYIKHGPSGNGKSQITDSAFVKNTATG